MLQRERKLHRNLREKADAFGDKELVFVKLWRNLAVQFVQARLELPPKKQINIASFVRSARGTQKLLPGNLVAQNLVNQRLEERQAHAINCPQTREQ